jgi:hypothetical protein
MIVPLFNLQTILDRKGYPPPTVSSTKIPRSFQLLPDSGSERMIDVDVVSSLRELQLWFFRANRKPDDMLQLLRLQELVEFLEKFARKMSGHERFAVGYEFIFVRTIVILFERPRGRNDATLEDRSRL